MSDYFAGSDWSQTYAKKALPVLVSLAESHRATTYTELAKILLGDKRYGHPLMSALGRLGRALESLNEAEPKKYGKIPPIELLVCNQRTGRPGNLGLNFLGYKKSEIDKMSEALLDTIISRAHQNIFEYPRWQHVLKAFGLKPVTLKLPAPESILPKIWELEQHATGEGEEHERLKLFLAQNPKIIGIQWKSGGDIERVLLSGDRLDISFRDDERWIAVEVKGKHSPLADLVRGIFQCVKYKVILAAQLRYEALGGKVHLQRTIPRVVLACGAPLPTELLTFAKSVDVEVRSGISVPEEFVPTRNSNLDDHVPLRAG
jgi:hypothetical protein